MTRKEIRRLKRTSFSEFESSLNRTRVKSDVSNRTVSKTWERSTSTCPATVRCTIVHCLRLYETYLGSLPYDPLFWRVAASFNGCTSAWPSRGTRATNFNLYLFISTAFYFLDCFVRCSERRQLFKLHEIHETTQRVCPLTKLAARKFDSRVSKISKVNCSVQHCLNAVSRTSQWASFSGITRGLISIQRKGLRAYTLSESNWIARVRGYVCTVSHSFRAWSTRRIPCVHIRRVPYSALFRRCRNHGRIPRHPKFSNKYWIILRYWTTTETDRIFTLMCHKIFSENFSLEAGPQSKT